MDKNIVNNIGAERAVLAGICQYGKLAYIDISDIISPNTFTIEANQATYKCLEKSLEESDTIDITSIIVVAETLGLSSLISKNKTDIEFIRSLFNFPIELENVRKHAKQIAKLELIRHIKGGLQEADAKLSGLDGTESVDKIVSIPEDVIFKITNSLNTGSENNPEQLGDGTLERLEYLANNPVQMLGIPTPWPIYNEIIGGGIRPGVAMIGARPKVGKSSLSINCGLHVSNILNIPVLYIDTEMNRVEQEDRIISCLSRINIRLLETGKFGKSNEYRTKVRDASNLLKTIPFYHKWVGGKPFSEIISIIRRWIFTTVKFDINGNLNPCLVLYDYFKLMDTSDLDKMQEYQAIGFQVSYLSDLCKQYNIPCLAFVQLNRDGITKDTSDIISQSDRLLWLCTSCAVFKRKEKEEIIEDGLENGNRKLILLEARKGEPLDQGDYINMNFDGKISKIVELNTKFQSKKINQGFEVNNDIVLTDVKS